MAEIRRPESAHYWQPYTTGPSTYDPARPQGEFSIEMEALPKYPQSAVLQPYTQPPAYENVVLEQQASGETPSLPRGQTSDSSTRSWVNRSTYASKVKRKSRRFTGKWRRRAKGCGVVLVIFFVVGFFVGLPAGLSMKDVKASSDAIPRIINSTTDTAQNTSSSDPLYQGSGLDDHQHGIVGGILHAAVRY
ncbi:uncharacterized protein BJX67DRAFT_384743 [Aspergillus lucknowensis]|uniref:Uncharacterized protein n=1 Tax=Aspergillus lucknowensis TaxID=176173 RepID=A0ABR4LG50_9EURO